MRRAEAVCMTTTYPSYKEASVRICITVSQYCQPTLHFTESCKIYLIQVLLLCSKQSSLKHMFSWSSLVQRGESKDHSTHFAPFQPSHLAENHSICTSSQLYAPGLCQSFHQSRAAPASTPIRAVQLTLGGFTLGKRVCQPDRCPQVSNLGLCFWKPDF